MPLSGLNSRFAKTMFWSVLHKLASSRRPSPLSRWWSDVRFRWSTLDKVPLIVGVAGVAVIGAFGLVMYSVVSRDQERRDLTCLALNVYYEARGEPAAGRYAVAEVTMNRVASRSHSFSTTGCRPPRMRISPFSENRGRL